MRKVLLSFVVMVLVIVIILAAIALGPVNAPAAETVTEVVEDCGVLSLDAIAMNPQQSAVQDAVYDRLNQVNPPVQLQLNDTGIRVTPAVSKCVPLADEGE